ncbi:Nitroreductase family [Carpediemonas membranifera]|uniref:Nitroreductase family n=1 Tax=Carpediemonas membranifera TaxID=201153 RepID=A0A8J6AUH7_9EUKA|nr:Nitroreductase family [Carpediemonas membranifera]|eukprot:KAG9394498.1 Nitroreductase family [Carpediemonas membranifera]
MTVPSYEDYTELIHKRQTVRHFTDRVPTKEEIEKVITAALKAPQPWKFHVVQDKEMIQKISSNTVEKATQAVIDRIMAGLGFTEPVEEPVFYGAPTVITITWSAGMGGSKGLDIGLAVMQLELAATTLGMGTINAGFSGMSNDMTRELLQLPEDEEIIVNVGIGFPERTEPTQPRFTLDERVTYH